MALSSTSISLRGLRTFCVAARYGSFRTAGEALFITPSAVSHQIKALEQELGQSLFERVGRELTLTETGKTLYADISPLIDQLNAVVARYKKGSRQSSVRISVQPFFASEFFVPRLRNFMADHPEVDIQVGTSDETSEKHPSDADLSIRLFRAPPANMFSQLLFPLRMAPAISPPLKKGIKLRGNKMVGDLTLIVHEARPKAWAQWANQSGVELPKDAKVVRLDSMIAVVRAVERGIGAALVPVPVGDLWFKNRAIVRLFDQDFLADVSYYLICGEDRINDAAVRRLCDWIITEFADLA